MSVESLLEMEKQLDHMVKRIKGTTPKMGDLLTKGDLCDLYRCSWEAPLVTPTEPVKRSRWEILSGADGSTDGAVQGVIKVCRSPADEDLVQNEINTLNLLYPPEQEEERFFRYLCKPLSTQPILILPYLDGYVSLEDVIKAHPEGIDYRDMAWMFNRLLEGLGFVNDRFFIHGAVVPSHFMVDVRDHGGKLIDWSYAVRIADNASIKAISATWRDLYPPEVFAKRFPTPATDVYMAAKTAVLLLGGNAKTNELPEGVPPQIVELLHSCLGELPSSRPQHPWDLRTAFGKVMVDLVGKPKFRRFRMPSV